MAIIDALSRSKHFDEFNEPLDTQEGVLAPSTRRARAIANLFGGDSDPGVAFPDDLEVAGDTLLEGGLTVEGASVFEGAVTAEDGIIQAAGYVFPIVPVVVQQEIDANGAISITSYDTALTTVTTTGQTFTLADGTKLGQLKRIHLVADGDDGTVTFNTNATLDFTDVGDYAVLIWDGADWIPISLGNEASGDIGPAYTPAS